MKIPIDYDDDTFGTYEQPKSKVRIALDKYNVRVAEHIAWEVGWTAEEILMFINDLKDNGGTR